MILDAAEHDQVEGQRARSRFAIRSRTLRLMWSRMDRTEIEAGGVVENPVFVPLAGEIGVLMTAPLPAPQVGSWLKWHR